MIFFSIIVISIVPISVLLLLIDLFLVFLLFSIFPLLTIIPWFGVPSYILLLFHGIKFLFHLWRRVRHFGEDVVQLLTHVDIHYIRHLLLRHLLHTNTQVLLITSSLRLLSWRRFFRIHKLKLFGNAFKKRRRLIQILLLFILPNILNLVVFYFHSFNFVILFHFWYFVILFFFFNFFKWIQNYLTRSAINDSIFVHKIFVHCVYHLNVLRLTLHIPFIPHVCRDSIKLIMIQPIKKTISHCII